MSDIILSKLNEMDGKLDELLTWKAVHKTEHKGISRDVVEIRETLFDNPGLKSQVQTLMNCKQDTFRWRDFWMWVLRCLTVSGIIGLIGWLMFIYKKN